MARALEAWTRHAPNRGFFMQCCVCGQESAKLVLRLLSSNSVPPTLLSFISHSSRSLEVEKWVPYRCPVQDGSIFGCFFSARVFPCLGVFAFGRFRRWPGPVMLQTELTVFVYPRFRRGVFARRTAPLFGHFPVFPVCTCSLWFSVFGAAQACLWCRGCGPLPFRLQGEKQRCGKKHPKQSASAVVCVRVSGLRERRLMFCSEPTKSFDAWYNPGVSKGGARIRLHMLDTDAGFRLIMWTKWSPSPGKLFQRARDAKEPSA